jgi:hypothetical protein
LKGLSFGRKWVRGLGLAAACAVTGSVRAQDPAPASQPPRLEYTTTPGCPDLASFRDELALMKADKFDPASSEVVRVTFAREPGGRYRGTVEYPPASGRPPETVTDTRCDAIVRQVALNASMAIPDPAPKAAPAPEQPKPLPPEPALKPAEPEPPKPQLFVPPPVPWQRFEVVAPTGKTLWQQLMDLSIGMNAFMFLTAAFSANVNGGAAIGADVRGEIVSFGVELRYVFPARAYAREVLKPGPGATPLELDVSQVSVLLVPCARWKYLVGCAVAQLGSAFYHSVQTVPEAHGDKFFFAAGGRLGFDVPLAERLSVFGFGEALGVPERPAFAFTNHDKDWKETGQVGWAQSPVSVFFGIGMSVKIK